MIRKIAWRNILRNKRRSLILVISIIIGVMAIVLTDGLSVGMMQQMLTNQIGADAGYIQVHKKGYQANPALKNSVADPEEIRTALAKVTLPCNVSERLRTFGIVSSAYNSSGVSILGVEPGSEKKVTTICKYVTKGTYLSGKPAEILISSSAAEKLKVELGDKVVVMASRFDGSIGSEACRVVGIFETFDSGFDQGHVYISLQTAQQMLGTDNRISEFVVNPVDAKQTDMVANEIRSKLTNSYEVLTYRQMLPLLVMQVQLYDETIYIFYAIIAIALIFGIVNTMLMAVMERTHEFGVDMAIGMSNRRIFAMILTEAAFLGIVGTAVGLVASFAIFIPLSYSGWNLAMFSESLRSLGVGTTIYPILTASSLVNAIVIIPIATIIGAVYPATRAIRLRPVEAIRAT
ncbi:MAG TPA: ABC transporter permease [Candidatus Acidoferrales bacterium]|nr:ABC transporter permease [Candidatus Acidoferrales bacterium]